MKASRKRSIHVPFVILILTLCAFSGVRPNVPLTVVVVGMDGEAGSDVTLDLVGTVSETATTGESGLWTFTVPAPGSYTITPTKVGHTFDPAEWSINGLSSGTTVIFNMCTPLGGVYTIGGASPDFASFADATETLIRCGVDAPTAFHVRPGTYVEGGGEDAVLDIPDPIRGAGPMNRVTFRADPSSTGDGVVLERSMSDIRPQPPVYLRSGYVTLEGLHLRNSGMENDGQWAVILVTGDTYTTRPSVEVTRSTLEGALVANAGSHDLVVTDNEIHGIVVITSYSSTSGPVVQPAIVGNAVTGRIFLANVEAPAVADNVVDFTSASSEMGIRIVNGTDVLVERNRVFATGGVKPHGIQLQSVDVGLVANNMVGGTGSERRYGITLASSDRITVAHNTILLPEGELTGPARHAAAFWQLSGTDNVVRNNIFINRTSGGSQVHSFAMILPDEGENAYDHNVLYSESGELVRYGADDLAALADWQATGMATGSASFLPSITAPPHDLHLSQSMEGDARLHGVPITAVSTDIDAEMRNETQPYIGADELGLCAPLAGAYTLGGASADFVSFADASDALMQCGVGGPVEIRARDGHYTTDSGPVLLLPGLIPGASAANTVTFLPEAPGMAGGVVLARTANGTVSTPVVDLRAGFVTLTRLVIRTEGVPDGLPLGAVVSISGAHGDVRENIRITENTITGRVRARGRNPDLQIRDNRVDGTIYLSWGWSSTEDAPFMPVVRGNEIRDPQQSGMWGIRMGSAERPTVQDNTLIYGEGTGYHSAISLGTCSDGVVEGNTVVGLRNEHSVGITMATSSGGLIANNMLSVQGVEQHAGIYLSSADDVLIAHNTVSSPPGPSEASAALFIYGSGNTVRNNILVDRGEGYHNYALRIDLPGNTSDYNVLYSQYGAAAREFHVPYQTLADWQATGADVHSVSMLPEYEDPLTDLHLAGTSVGDPQLAGTPVPDVLMDIDDEVRSTTAPTIGADEAGLPVVTEFVVNDNGDAADAQIGDLVCDVDLAASGPQCTLRAAISELNATGGGPAIRFDLPDGPTIRPASALPALEKMTHLNPDGATVELDGSLAGGSASGLHVQADGTQVHRVVINRFGSHGILVTGRNNTLSRVVVGLNVAQDTVGFGNGGDGIHIRDGEENHVLGSVTAGNTGAGIRLQGEQARGNRIVSSFVGTNMAGEPFLGNGSDGIRLDSGASSNEIGGETFKLANIISGNAGNGVAISGSEVRRSGGNMVRQNWIGVAPIFDGGNLQDAKALSNGGSGIALQNSVSNTIASNTIAANAGSGLSIVGPAAMTNRVVGNAVGAIVWRSADAVEHVKPMGNGGHGIAIEAGASGSRIGPSEGEEMTTSRLAFNYIVANGGYGVSARASNSDLYLANRIGTVDEAREIRAFGLENGMGGMRVEASDNAVIGQPRSGNLISGGRSADGIQLVSSNKSLVQFNEIRFSVRGIYARGGSGQITRNRFVGNAAAIVEDEADPPVLVVEENVIEGPPG